ncbi:hypothetical protein [Henriciella sp.]|uniref:RusA family crossover junction endodeoxyribonuclease n=1 Tax=Henriciella sp. TaxID=1968823 RepID=UPI00260B67D7|nr:hypothetical protein [Henriciella sp.]
MRFRTLPIPPSVNGMFPGKARRHKSADYKAWIEHAGWVLETARIPPVIGPFALHIRLPVKMRGDIGNREKAISDLLVKHGVTPDDSKTWRITIERHPNVRDCSCQFALTEIDPNTGAERAEEAA